MAAHVKSGAGMADRQAGPLVGMTSWAAYENYKKSKSHPNPDHGLDYNEWLASQGVQQKAGESHIVPLLLSGEAH